MHTVNRKLNSTELMKHGFYSYFVDIPSYQSQGWKDCLNNIGVWTKSSPESTWLCFWVSGVWPLCVRACSCTSTGPTGFLGCSIKGNMFTFFFMETWGRRGRRQTLQCFCDPCVFIWGLTRNFWKSLWGLRKTRVIEWCVTTQNCQHIALRKVMFLQRLCFGYIYRMLPMSLTLTG